ncbi:DUF4297 domain-containing protein [Chryseolinea serpens]|nr:DUF4297 domain-containing protein [Chryseolinea serpens]
MTLKVTLNSNKPRDRGGSTNSNRTGFQLTWALCKLLELHKGGEDYVMIFDYHDDIAIVDSASNPSAIEFYQIKTKDPGTWSLSDLLRSRKSKKKNLLSIIGRMYDSTKTFKDHAKSVNFISNAKFNFDLSSIPRSLNSPKICLNELKDGERRKVADKLKLEHKSVTLVPYEATTHFSITDLSVRDHENHAVSYVLQFLEHIGGVKEFQVKAVQQAIAAQIRAKNNYEWNIDGYENIIRYKAITKEFLDKIVNSNRSYADLSSRWTEVSQVLTSEGVHFSIRKEIGTRWKEYEVLRMDEANLTIQQLRVNINTALNKHKGNNADSLMGYIITVKRELCLDVANTEHFLTAMILIEYYEERKL